MATMPTPEESARLILKMFVEDAKYCPGDALGSNNMLASWSHHRLDDRDLKPGLDYAEAKGWIEIFDRGDSIRLTQAGYGAATALKR